MIILDPFIGVSPAGKFIAGTLNKILILAEAAFLAAAIWLQITDNVFGGTFLAILIIGLSILAFKLLNRTLHILSKGLLVLLFGTTDTKKIEEDKSRAANKKPKPSQNERPKETTPTTQKQPASTAAKHKATKTVQIITQPKNRTPKPRQTPKQNKQPYPALPVPLYSLKQQPTNKRATMLR